MVIALKMILEGRDGCGGGGSSGTDDDHDNGEITNR